MWFQRDVPNPGVDLSKLYGKGKDIYPNELKDKLGDSNYFTSLWIDKIDKNFDNDELKRDRMFENPYFKDQYEDIHLPMKFISQITSPDLLDLEYIDPEDLDSDDKKILSAPQIAHFVR